MKGTIMTTGPEAVDKTSSTAWSSLTLVPNRSSSPEVSRRKLGKKWMKLARKAYMRSHLPKRIRKAVEEALREHPDAAVMQVREVVESKVGVGLCGKYGVLFDKALLRGTAKVEKPRRPRKRFVLAVARRRRAKGAPPS